MNYVDAFSFFINRVDRLSSDLFGFVPPNLCPLINHLLSCPTTPTYVKKDFHYSIQHTSFKDLPYRIYRPSLTSLLLIPVLKNHIITKKQSGKKVRIAYQLTIGKDFNDLLAIKICQNNLEKELYTLVLEKKPEHLTSVQYLIDYTKKEMPRTKVVETFYQETLFDYLCRKSIQTIDDTICRFLTTSIAISLLRGLAFLEEHGWVHNDIKPQNIFINSDTNSFSFKRICIGDFDLASKKMSGYHSNVGTPYFMSPEASRNLTNTSKDVFALGLTLIFCIALLKTSDSRLSRSLIYNENETIPTLFLCRIIYLNRKDPKKDCFVQEEVNRVIDKLSKYFEKNPKMITLINVIASMLVIDHTQRITGQKALETLNQAL